MGGGEIQFNPVSCQGNGYRPDIRFDQKEVISKLEKCGEDQSKNTTSKQFLILLGDMEEILAGIFKNRKADLQLVVSALLRLMEICLQLAHAYHREGKSELALSYYERAYKIASALNNKDKQQIEIDPLNCLPAADKVSFNELIKKAISQEFKYNSKGYYMGPGFGCIQYSRQKLLYKLGEACFGVGDAKLIDEAKGYFEAASVKIDLPIGGCGGQTSVAESTIWVVENGKKYYCYQARARVALWLIDKENEIKTIEDLSKAKRYNEVLRRLNANDFTKEVLPKGLELSEDYRKKAEMADIKKIKYNNCRRALIAAMWAYYNIGKALGNKELLSRAYNSMLFMLKKADSHPTKNEQIHSIIQFFMAKAPGRTIASVGLNGNIEKVFKEIEKAPFDKEQLQEFFKKDQSLTDDAIFMLTNIIGLLGDKENLIVLIKQILSNNPPQALRIQKKKQYLEVFVGKLIKYYSDKKEYDKAAVLYWHILGENPLGKDSSILGDNNNWKMVLLKVERDLGLDIGTIREAAKAARLNRVNTQINLAWMVYEMRKKNSSMLPDAVELSERIFSAIENQVLKEAGKTEYYGKEQGFKNIKNLAQVYERIGFIYSKRKSVDPSKERLYKQKGSQRLGFSRRLYQRLIEGTGGGDSTTWPGSLEADKLQFNSIMQKIIDRYNQSFEVATKNFGFIDDEMSKTEIEMELLSGYANVLKKLEDYIQAELQYRKIYDQYSAEAVKPRFYPGVALGYSECLVRRKEYDWALKICNEVVRDSYFYELTEFEQNALFTNAVLNYSWILTEKGSLLKGRIGEEKEAARHFGMAVALLRALAYGLGGKNGVDPKYLKAKKVARILEKRNELLSKGNLGEIDLTLADIKAELAGKLKAVVEIRHFRSAADLYDEALKEYKSQKKEGKVSEILYKMAENYAQGAQLFAREGNIADALASAQKAIGLAKESVKKLRDHKDLLSAYFALSWAQSMRGELLKKQGKFGLAKKAFEEALSTYFILLDYKRFPKYHKLLKGLKHPYLRVRLEAANLYKSMAGVSAKPEEEGKYLALAQAEYKRIKGVEPTVIFAESLIEEGKLLAADPKNKALAASKFEQAYKQLKVVVDSYEGKKFKLVKEAAVALAAKKDLGWVLSEKARLEHNDSKLLDQALAVYRDLLNSKQLTSKSVLESSGITLWDIRTSYINTLQDKEESLELLALTDSFLPQLEAKKTRTVEEDAFLLNAYLARANSHCWILAKEYPEKEKEYFMAARIGFEKAILLAESEAFKESEDKNVSDILLYARQGLAFVLIKDQDFDAAELSIRDVVAVLEKEEPKRHKLLAQAYSIYGMLYSEKKEPAKAVEYLEKALNTYETKVINSRKERVQARHALGNAFLLYGDEKYYPEALKNFKAALALLGDSKLTGSDRRMIAGIRKDLGRLYKDGWEFKEAYRELEAAEKILPKSDLSEQTKKIKKDALREWLDTQRVEDESKTTVEAGFRYSKGNYEDDKLKAKPEPEESSAGFARALIRFGKNWLGGAYLAAVSNSRKQYNLDGNTLMEFDPAGMEYKLWASYMLEKPKFNLTVTPSLGGEYNKFTIYEEHATQNRSAHETFFSGFTLALKAEGALKFNVLDDFLMLMPYAGVDGRVTIRGGNNNIGVKRQGIEDAIDGASRWYKGTGSPEAKASLDRAKEDLLNLPDENRPLAAIGSQLGLRFILPFIQVSEKEGLSISMAPNANAGYDPSAAGGFYENDQQLKWAMGMALKFVLRSKAGWDLSLDGTFQQGNYLFWEGNLSGGYKVGEKLKLEAGISISGYQEESDTTKVENMGGMGVFRLKF